MQIFDGVGIGAAYGCNEVAVGQSSFDDGATNVACGSEDLDERILASVNKICSAFERRCMTYDPYQLLLWVLRSRWIAACGQLKF